MGSRGLVTAHSRTGWVEAMGAPGQELVWVAGYWR